MGRDPTMDKLLLHCGSHPRCCKMATIWLIPKTAEKPIDGRTKRRKGDKHEKNTAG